MEWTHSEEETEVSWELWDADRDGTLLMTQRRNQVIHGIISQVPLCLPDVKVSQ